MGSQNGGDGGNWRLCWDARSVVLIVALIIILGSSVMDWLFPWYDIPIWVGAVMGSIVAFILGGNIIHRKGDDEK
jgi:hypothetical protein